MKNKVFSVAEDDIPINKLLRGTFNVSNNELISLIIGRGNNYPKSLDTAIYLMEQFNNDLGELWKADINTLANHLNLSSAAQLLACIELGNRKYTNIGKKRIRMKSSMDIYNHYKGLFTNLIHEEFHVLLLNNGLNVIRSVKLSEGGLTGTVVDVRKLFSIALANHAIAIVCLHNHPGEICKPSEQDILITRKIVQAGDILTIKVIDHLIFTSDSYYSFADDGMLSD